MNEQIRELAEQAGMTDDKYGMFFAKDKHNEDGVDLEKFAELIVRECVKAADEWYQYHNEIQWDPGEHIKQHFGVEE